MTNTLNLPTWAEPQQKLWWVAARKKKDFSKFSIIRSRFLKVEQPKIKCGPNPFLLCKHLARGRKQNKEH